MADAKNLHLRVMGLVENTVRVAGAFSACKTITRYVLHKQTNAITRIDRSIMIGDLSNTGYSAICQVMFGDQFYSVVSHGCDGSVLTSQYYMDKASWETKDEMDDQPKKKNVDDSPCSIRVPIPRKARMFSSTVPVIFH